MRHFFRLLVFRIILILGFLGPLGLHASHIVGGQVSYQCLGSNNYKVTLTLFRDCSGVTMPDSAEINILDGSGNLTVVKAPKGPSTFLNINQPACAGTLPNVCIETADYVINSVNLPVSTNGYTFFYQGCCRNSSVDNIPNAWQIGATIPAYLYGNSSLCNSSPVFTQNPPLVLVENVPMQVNLGATDPDGDSLYYQLCPTLSNSPAAPPFTSVPYAAGYSATNPMPASPAMTINHQTGEITGTPNQVGKYVISVSVTEYRNGSIIGKIQRDYQFTVVTAWKLFAYVSSQSNASCNGSSLGSATIGVTNGVSPLTYAWSNGATTQTATGLAPGNYSVIVTGANGCVDTVNLTISSGSTLNASLVSKTNISCGQNTASATISVNGGVAPYSITWPDGSGGLTNSNLSAGLNVVSVTDNGGCSDTIHVNIIATSGINATIDSIASPQCAGTASGYLKVKVTGGTGPYTYSWSNGYNQKTNTTLPAGNGWVSVVDQNGCKDSLNFTIPAVDSLKINLDSLKNPACANNGYLSVSVTGGHSPYTLVWNNGSHLYARNNLTSGTYTVSVSDSRGCTMMAQYTLVQGPALQLSLKSSSNVSCNGNNDGSLSVHVTGGVPPYNFNWTNASGDSVLTNLLAGTYNLTLTDAAGCSQTGSYTITEPNAISIISNSISGTSCGQNNGNATIAVSGGTPPYTISWDNGQSGLSANNLTSGNHIVNVIDSHGCDDSLQVNIPAIAPVTANLDSLLPPTCAGGTNGFASASATGGTPPYSYQWSNGATSSTVNNLSSGNGYVIISGSNGCKDSLTFNIPVVDTLKIVLDSLRNPACGNNGYLAINVLGGQTPYSVQWNIGSALSTLNNLGSGNYGVTVTDSRGCSTSAQYTLAQTTGVQVMLVNSTDVSCNGGNDGSLQIHASGGILPYTYSWANTTGDSILTNLSAGTYTVTVTDASGCYETVSFSINEPSPITIATTKIDAASCGQNNGTATIAVSGGTSPYVVNWDNGQTGNTAINFNSGMHTVFVTDAHGCTDSLQINIPVAPSVAATVDSLLPPACAGGNDAFAHVHITGGVAPYSYYWNNGDTLADNNSLTSGNGYVVVTDINGCSDSVLFSIPVIDTLQISLDSLKNPACGNNGYLAVNIFGGQAPYSVQWTNGANISTLNNLGSGSYGVTVTDSRGCSASAQYTLVSSTGVQVSLKNLSDVNCHGGNDGSLAVHINGGVPPYNFNWTNASGDSVLTNLSAGTYILTVGDAGGCSQTVSYTINEPSAISIFTDSTVATSCGQNNGWARISVNGGTAPYLINWDNGQTGLWANNLSSGNHIVFVADAHGCGDSLQINIPAISAVMATVDSMASPVCAGGNNGFASISVNGGVPPYSFNWDNGSATSINSNLSSGDHYVIVTDQNGCMDSIPVIIPAKDTLKINLANLSDVLCTGDNNGELEIQITGGEAPYSINWSNGATGTLNSNIAAGNYTVQVNDSRGCSASASYQLNQPDPFVVVVDSVQAPSCKGEDDGQVFLRALGGQVIANIVSNKGKVSFNNVSELEAGNYNVWIENTNGCGTNVQFTIPDPNPIKVDTRMLYSPTCNDAVDGIIELSASGGSGGPFTYTWPDGDTGAFRNDLSAGSYTVIVTDNRGCSAKVPLYLAPKQMLLNADVTPSGCFDSYDGVVMIEVKGAVEPYTLSLNDNPIQSGLNYLDGGTYNLHLRDAVGCEIQKTISISDKDKSKVYFANTFTPNDDGINDHYEIKGDQACFTNAQLEVYNRWGQRVFVSNDPFHVFWDGTFNGQLAPSGVYVYSFTSDNYKEQGSFKIMR